MNTFKMAIPSKSAEILRNFCRSFDLPRLFNTRAGDDGSELILRAGALTAKEIIIMQQKSDNVVEPLCAFEAPVRIWHWLTGISVRGGVDGHRILYRQAATFRQRRGDAYLVLIWATSG